MGMIDLFLTFGGIGADEVLVNGKAGQVNAIAKRVAFQFLQVRAVRGGQGVFFRDVHLAMKDVEAFHADFRGLIDDGFDGNFFGLKMPIGVSGDAQLDPLFAIRGGSCSFLFFSAKRESGAKTGSGGEEGAAIDHNIDGSVEQFDGLGSSVSNFPMR